METSSDIHASCFPGEVSGAILRSCRAMVVSVAVAIGVGIEIVRGVHHFVLPPAAGVVVFVVAIDVSVLVLVLVFVLVTATLLLDPLDDDIEVFFASRFDLDPPKVAADEEGDEQKD